MTTLFFSFKQANRLDDLEADIECLVRQKNVLQGIEGYTNNALDFGDVLETHCLLVGEIERLQGQLRDKVCAVEEEEDSSFSSKYNIEHVVEGGDRKLRRVKPEDLDIESNKGVRDAFKVIYEYQRCKSYEEDEEEGEASSSRFDVENQERFLELVKRIAKDKRPDDR